MLRRLVPRVANLILADEPGVGKTLQALSVLHHFSSELGRPNLVLAPLSVVGQWKSEAQRFFPSLRVLTYAGNKDERQKIRETLETTSGSGCPFHVFVTSYELAILDAEFLGRVRWNLLVVDEAHRLKNSNTILYKQLNEEYAFRRRVFLTGTPVMNNLDEFTNLLQFLHPEIRDFSGFVADKIGRDRLTETLVLRRLASQVNLKLPDRVEYLIKIPLTGFQKSMYKWALAKEGSNVIAALRKVCNHPYLFDGVEPEPFMNGEHIMLNSAKLMVLDGLLKRIKNEKILLFSTSTQFLDIVQDLLDLRAVNYERLDGSVRGADRYRSIENFSSSEHVSVFLLSVRAGGLGLCLTAASVVVILDEDFNPHFTRQGIARAYRQGQTKNVTVYRLICQHTLDEVVYRRGVAKLKLSADVLNEHDVLSKEEQTQLIAFGLSKLNLTQTQSELTSTAPPKAERAPQVDLDAYDVDQLLASAERVSDRPEADEAQPDAQDLEIMRTVRPVAASELEGRDRARRFNNEDRDLIRRVMEQNRKKRLAEREQFPSLAVTEEEEAESVADAGTLRHVRGDVLSPEGGRSMIFLPVTGEGRFVASPFGELQKQRFPQAADYLRRARKAKALNLGDLHVLEFPDGGGISAVGLAVCLSDEDLDMAALASCLRRVSRSYALHIPRLGDRSGQFYAVERTLQHSAVARGVTVQVYYFIRSSPAVAPPPLKKPRLAGSVRDFFAPSIGHSMNSGDKPDLQNRLHFSQALPESLLTALRRTSVVFNSDVEVVEAGGRATLKPTASSEEFLAGGYSVTSEVLEFLLLKYLSSWK